MNTEVKVYNRTARIIHWVTALSVFGLFGLGLWMMTLDYYSEWYRTAPEWHKSIGLLLAGLTLFRIIWKVIKPSPKIDGSRSIVVMAKVAHFSLYLLLLSLFVSGYLISTEDGRAIAVFNWFEIPGAGKLFEGQAETAGAVHYYSAMILVGLSVLHALAALKHHFINKDNTLRKMIGMKK